MRGLLVMKQIYLLYAFAFLFSNLFFSQSDKDKEEAMYTSFDKGYNYVYVERDSAYHFLEDALMIASEISDYEASLGILDYIIITADYHHDLPKFRSSLQQFKSQLSEQDIALKVQDVEKWNIGYLVWLASYHFETMEYAKAKEQFLEARDLLRKIEPEQRSTLQDETLYTIYSSLGTTYMNLGNYELAELNYQRSIQHVNNSKALKVYADDYITGANQSLAQLYTQMGKHDEAHEFYIKNLNWSKEYYQKDKRYKNNLVNAFQKITISYLKQDSLQKALGSLNESHTYFREKDSFYEEAFVLNGDIYSAIKNYQVALDNYQKALAILVKESENQTNQAVAEVYGKIAVLYLKQKKYEEGLKTIQKAFNTSSRNIKITEIQEYPDLAKVFSKRQLLHLLDIKLQLLGQADKRTPKPELKDDIIKTCEAILKTFDFLKNEFDSKLDKMFLAESAYPTFHRMLAAVFEISSKEPSLKYVQLALNISEKNKDFILLEALRNSQASNYGEVPQELLDKEAQLRSEITFLEKEIFDTESTEINFSESLFKVKQEYYDFLEDLKISYPKYHNLKYQTSSIDLEEIREKLLVNNGTLISFTISNSHLYAIIVDGSKEKLMKLPFSNSDKLEVRDFYQLISKPSLNDSQTDISNLGRKLYNSILKRPMEGFETENLTIIPDGQLHYLPFDLLKKEEDYLLQTMNFSYGNSVASLLELKGEKSKEIKLLGFAPSFKGIDTENTERQFGKLRYNGDEVGKIESFFNAKTYLKKEATLQNFVSNASKYNILHLATHASANDEYPDYSYLAFTETKDSTESNILYIKDLYNMTLNANMVTLSACQTGIGKLQKGQGMMSLSKGFYYAGAKSIVNTLWKINDKSTVQLMENFYEELSRGKSKTEALRLAKLKYLESTDDKLLKHPYYWAAFVVSGDASPITNNNTLMWVLGLGFIPLLLVGFFSKRRKDFKKIQLVN